MRSSTATSSRGITLTSEPTRRRANRGACSSRARKSWVARRSAAASSARPPASITAINAPARYSPTSSVPDQRQHRNQIDAGATAPQGDEHPDQRGYHRDQCAGDPATVCDRMPPRQPCDSTGRQRADRAGDEDRLNARLPTGLLLGEPLPRRAWLSWVRPCCVPRVTGSVRWPQSPRRRSRTHVTNGPTGE